MTPFLGAVGDHRDGGRRRLPPPLLIVERLLLGVLFEPAVQDRERSFLSGLFPFQRPECIGSIRQAC